MLAAVLEALMRSNAVFNFKKLLCLFLFVLQF